MAVIYSYPTKANPVGSDLILISDSADSNKTKQVKVSSLPSSGGGSVSSVELSLSGIAAFAITGDNPITSSGTIILGTTGGSAGQFLDYQGNWSTPAGVSSVTSANTAITVADSTTAPVLTSVAYSGGNNIGHVPTGGSGTTYLKGDGTWDTPSGSGSYTAGDGLQLNATTFSTDLKLNGGLAIETTSLALDLSASSITGTLATSDGGTGSSSTEYCNLEANVTGTLPVGKGGTGVAALGASRLILGNGINAVTSISSQTKGTLVVGNNTTTTTLAVGATNGHVLTIDSSEATGVRWTAATVAASDVTGTLSVSEGGTGSSADPVEIGSIMFGNANEDGYETANDFKYLNSSLTNSTSSTTLPSGYFTSNNATVVGTAGASYSASIGAVNIFNPSTVSGSVPLVVGSSYPQANINTSRLITFYGGSSGGAGSFRCGDIFSDASALSMSLSNASDYRLKENVSSIEGSTVKINALNPVNYNIIGQTTVVEGFLAHELQEQFPNAVIGDKDALDINGDINPQMVDYTKVIPALVGAIKELTARIEALEA
jgi:hypothetical protein